MACCCCDFTNLTQQDLLDFSKPFDVGLMDKVVMTFYTSSGAEVRRSVVAMLYLILIR